MFNIKIGWLNTETKYWNLLSELDIDFLNIEIEILNTNTEVYAWILKVNAILREIPSRKRESNHQTEANPHHPQTHQKVNISLFWNLNFLLRKKQWNYEHNW